MPTKSAEPTLPVVTAAMIAVGVTALNEWLADREYVSERQAVTDIYLRMAESESAQNRTEHN